MRALDWAATFETIRPAPMSAARRRRAVAMAAAGATVLLSLPLVWFTGVVARTEFAFTAIESWVFGLPTAIAGLVLLLGTALLILRPDGFAGLLAYGAGVSCVAFALLAWITADAVTGLVPTPGGAELLGIETGPGILLVFVGGILGGGAGLLEVLRWPGADEAGPAVLSAHGSERDLEPALSPSWAADAVARWDDDPDDDGW